MGLLCNFVIALTFTFYDPILSPRLEKELEVRADFVFILINICVAVGSFVVGKISNVMDPRIVLTGGLVVTAISVFLTGGVKNDSVVATIIGIVGWSFCIYALTVPVIAEVSNVMEIDVINKYADIRNKKIASLALDDSTEDRCNWNTAPIQSNHIEKSCAMLLVIYALGALAG